MIAVLPLAGVESLPGSDLLVPVGGAAALLALLGLLLLLPLYVTQRREIGRLLAWREIEPQAGDREGADVASERMAATAATAAPRPMTAAERVTSERPALTRIGTAERAALRPLPLWRRVFERGPRHPLVLSLLVLALAVAIFVAAALFLRAGSDEQPGGGGTANGPAATEVVVVNASTSPGLAGLVAGEAQRLGYTVGGTGAVAEASKQSVVRYATGAKRAATSVARRLEIGVVQPFDPEAEAAADGADVVVIVGEDRAAKASGGQG